MSTAQKFGQVIAVALLSGGPIAIAMGWVGHVIEDPGSVAGTLAVNSVVGLIIAFFVIGVVVATVALIFIWVWVLGIAWSSDEARGKASVE